MTPAVRRLMAEDLRANAGWFGVAALMFAALNLFSDSLNILAPLVLQIFVGQRALESYRARWLLLLSRSELARAQWWLMIGFPGVAWTILGFAVWATRAMFGPVDAIVVETGGSPLWIWTVLCTIAATSLRRGLNGIIYTVVAQFALGIALFLLLLILAFLVGLDPAARAIIAIGPAAALYLYLRPVHLVRPPVRPGAAKRPSPSSAPASHLAPTLAGWRSWAGPCAWRLLTPALVVGPFLALRTLPDAFPPSHPLPTAPEAMSIICYLLLVGAGPAIFIGNALMLYPLLRSARPVLQQLPLTADALAARLVGLALAPGAVVMLVVAVAYAALPIPVDASVRVLFILMLMSSIQAFSAVAVVRRSLWAGWLAIGLPAIAALLPAFVVTKTLPDRLPRLALPPFVEAALGAPAWSALAVVAALAMIAAAYKLTRRALRARDVPRRGTMMPMLGGLQ